MNFDLTSRSVQWKMAFSRLSSIEDSKGFKNASDIILAGMKVYDADVPGNFELDLQRNGLIGDPFFGKNVLALHQYEDCHIWYFTSFSLDIPAGRDAFLVFEGLDTYAEIYLNGSLIASTDNMLIEHRIPLDGLLKNKNELMVHLKPACIEALKYEYTAAGFSLKYNYESLHVRKAPHMFGWDIMPRIVSAGIWRPVHIEFKPRERIEEFYLQTAGVADGNGKAELVAYYRIRTEKARFEDFEISIRGSCGDSTFEIRRRIPFCTGQMNISVGNAKLWWPKGRGTPDLYEVSVKLLQKGELMDNVSVRHGIRTVELDRSGVTDDSGGGRFCFVINRERVFVKGTNWVPADAFHSRDRERIPRMLALAEDLGCNMIRCWGGNVYEDDVFYEICDKAGIMIWQDFSMACAVYPQSEDFGKRLALEAEAVIKRLRQHPCIVLWAGDNECDQAYSWSGISRDPNSNILTRKVLPEIIGANDPARPYLPSSPFVDEAAFEKGQRYLSENHLWGPRDYYKSDYYRQSLCHFASEIGYHGCPGTESIKKFISAEKLWPYEDNEEWLVHAACPKLEEDGPYNYRIELMAKQIRELFGKIPDNLEDFSLASQISQAEALKFFIEFFRSRKWRRTGIIWWNLMDGWPQFSDAVVDYYFEKKLAYEYIKRAQQPVCIVIKEPENFRNEVVVCNDTRGGMEIEFEIRDAEEDRMILKGCGYAGPDQVSCLGEIPYTQAEKSFYMIRWKTKMGHGVSHYLSGTPAFDYETYVKWMRIAGLKVNDIYT